MALRSVCRDGTPIYQGLVNRIGAAQGDGALVSDTAIQGYWGSGDRFGCVAVRPGLVYWAVAQARPLHAATPSADMHSEIADLFARWPEFVARIIQATPAHAIRLIAVHDLEPLHTWSRANVLLVGDAPHAPLPTSGQGACQALEDAWHLARCLDGTDGGLEEALLRFAEVRGPKTSKPAGQGRVFPRDLISWHVPENSATNAVPYTDSGDTIADGTSDLIVI